MKIYLCGGLKTNWQKKFISKFLERQFTIYNPVYHGYKLPEQYIVWDLHYIKECDLVFAYMESSNPSGYGLAAEIAYAKALNKTVILIDERSEVDEEFARYFLFVKNMADISFSNYNDGINYLSKFV